LSPAMRSNAGMANRQGDVDLRFAQVSSLSYMHAHTDTHTISLSLSATGNLKLQFAFTGKA